VATRARHWVPNNRRLCPLDSAYDASCQPKIIFHRIIWCATAFSSNLTTGGRGRYGSSSITFSLLLHFSLSSPQKSRRPYQMLELSCDILDFNFNPYSFDFCSWLFCKTFIFFSITSFNLNLWYIIFFNVVLILLIVLFFCSFVKLIFLLNFTLQ